MLLDADTLKKSAEMDPAILEFAMANPAPPLDWANAASVASIIAMVEAQTSTALGPAEAGIHEYTVDIPMRDGFSSSLEIDAPASKPASGSPLIVLYFGGGFISGSAQQMRANARALVRLFGAVVVSASYRLAPEHKFPTAQNDGWDSLKWAASHADQLNADPTKGFLIGGVSAGGVIAASLAALSIEEPLAHPLTGQWLCVPGTMSTDTVPEKYKPYWLALEHNTAAPILNSEDVTVHIKKHTEWDEKSPLRHVVTTKVPLGKLPPAYFQSCGLDPLRDDALIWDEMLKEAGVKTRIDFYPGCPHGFWSFMPGLQKTNEALSDIFLGFGWLLGKEVTREQGLGSLVPAAG